MSFLSLDSLFRSSRGESNDNEEASAVTDLSFWATTHDNDGYQDIVLGFRPGTLSGLYHRDHEEEDSFSGTIVSSAPSSDIPPQGHESHVGSLRHLS